MKKKLIIALTVLFALSAPFGAMAMSHEKDGHEMHETMEHKGHDHDMHEKMEGHGGMEMKGDMAMLGNDTEDGVKAMAHLKDVQEAMAEMGMPGTHHIMVMFMDTSTGEPIEEGIAAVKIKYPSGKESSPIKLMGMQGHFGADIRLSEKGEHKFMVGTKLADGKKRQFEFEYKVK